jgi:hypothetical protein
MDLTVAANVRQPTNDPLLGRNWFNALRVSRDGVDPLMSEYSTTHTMMGDPELFANVLQITIPGTPGVSLPFRPQGYVQNDVDGVPDAPGDVATRDESITATILRDIARTSDGLKQGLFEARTESDLTGQDSSGDDTVDYHTRHRLLAKLHNRTTNRSHVYMVWTTIGFFEAHQLAANGQVQIGGEVQDLPRRRSFMVCDLSRIEEAYSDPLPQDSASVGQFDFRNFVIYRKLIP